MTAHDMSDDDLAALQERVAESHALEDSRARLVPIDWRKKALDLEMECTRLMSENANLMSELAGCRNALAAVREVRGLS